MKLNKLIIKLLRVFSVFFFKNTVLLHFIGDAVIFIKFFKNRTLAAFIAVLLCAGVTYAAEPSLSAIVMPEKGTVGQPMTYTLTISGINPDEVKIVLPEKKVVFPDKKDVKKSGGKSSSDRGKSSEEFVPLYIINSAVRDESEVNGNRQIHVKIILSYFRPGNYTLPEIKVSGNDGISIGYKIPVVIIEEINAEGNLEEIEPPVSIGGNYTRLVLILVLLVLIAAAAVSVYFYFKKRKKPPVALEPALPPIEIFLNAVESMKLRELPAKGRINEYVFGISIIFRRYIYHLS